MRQALGAKPCRFCRLPVVFCFVIATYHNHSKWSDGSATFAEIYACAEGLGVDILGLSDHLCIYPDGTSPKWSMSPSRTEDYLTEVCSFRGAGKIEVRVGLELDWLGKERNAMTQIAGRLPLDYRIGSVHHVEGQQFDASPSYWSEKSAEERDAVFAKYWGLVRDMAASSFFDIAAHLDLAKKLGYQPTSDPSPAIDAALDAIAESRMVVELNTSGFSRPCADAYPSLEILKRCRGRGIAITLSADGHIPGHLIYEFERGLARLHQAGFTSIARFREREKWFEPLGDALKRGRA